MGLISEALHRFRTIITNATEDIIGIPTARIGSAMSSAILQATWEDPETLFKFLMGTLVAIGVTAKLWPHIQLSNWIGIQKNCPIAQKKCQEVASLQKRYLPVFYLFRMSFWMSGPYFYQAYYSKKVRHLDGTTSPATSEFVARVSLVGYLAIVLLGPMVGRLIDRSSRKTATLCTGAMYAIGSLSVFFDTTIVLYLGRAMASIASSRLTTSPEAWLIQEYLLIKKKQIAEEIKPDEGALSQTFGLAYGGDAIVAIVAGQAASMAASNVGHPTGPFLVSPFFVAIALLVTFFFWAENKEVPEEEDDDDGNGDGEQNRHKHSMGSAAKVIFSDPKILLIGLVQSLFEGSMYIFVLVWPPALSSAIQSYFGTEAATPFGTIFSCFMACCLLGSVLVGQLQNKAVNVKIIMTGILMVSTVAFAWAASATQVDNILSITSAFFAFEMCVGMYFPSIGIIRSELLPESHRLAITTLFAVPLNVLVVGVISFQPLLGNVGSLVVAEVAMGFASICMLLLIKIIRKEEQEKVDKAVEKAVMIFKESLKFKQNLSSSSSTRRVSEFERLSLQADTMRRRQSSCVSGGVP